MLFWGGEKPFWKGLHGRPMKLIWSLGFDGFEFDFAYGVI